MPKRAAQTQANIAAPAAKLVKRDPAMQAVADGLQKAADAGLLGETAAKMLDLCIPGALGVVAAERHETQVKAIAMLEEVLLSVKEQLQTASVAANTTVSELEASKGDLDTKRTTAEEVAAVAAQALEEAAEALSHASSHAFATEGELQSKRASERDAQSLLQEANVAKDAFFSGVEHHFTPLQDGEFSEAGPEPHKLALLGMLEGAGVEESLFLAFPSSCVKSVSARTSFDTMVFQAVAQAVEKRQEELVHTVKDKTSALEACLLDRQAGEQALEAALEAKKAAEERVAQASEAKAKAETAVAEAIRAQASFEPTFAAALTGKEERGVDLDNFTGYNLGYFETLRDGRQTMAVNAGA